MQIFLHAFRHRNRQPERSGGRTDGIYAEGSDSCLRVIYTKIRFLYITRPSSPAAAPPPAPNPADNFYVRYAVGWYAHVSDSSHGLPLPQNPVPNTARSPAHG